jgi:hypothetical protein
MGNVVQFRRPLASATVIAKLVELGYLRHAKRHKTAAIELAIARLRQDLNHDGGISEGDVFRALPNVVDDAAGEKQ